MQGDFDGENISHNQVGIVKNLEENDAAEDLQLKKSKKNSNSLSNSLWEFDEKKSKPNDSKEKSLKESQTNVAILLPNNTEEKHILPMQQAMGDIASSENPEPSFFENKKVDANLTEGI